ncbi:MAG: hypothetical protein ACNA8P_00380 [Phycisphaerales bacterium]
MQRLTLILGLTLCVVQFAGCARGLSSVDLDAGRLYPQDKIQNEVLDVQVVRDMARISITNTTGRDFGRSILWLNQEFSKEIPSWAVGETILLDLSRFENQYGARFRAGGFFATERPKNVVLAQLETQDDSQSLLGLIVVQGAVRR